MVTQNGRYGCSPTVAGCCSTSAATGRSTRWNGPNACYPPGVDAAGAMVLATLAAALERKGHFAEAAARAQQAARIADEVGDPTLRVSASATLGLALARLDRHAEALTELKSAQALADTA